MEGKLEHFDLLEVIASLAKTGRRGCIRISYPEGEGEIYFSQNWINKITLNPNPVPFGNRLVRKKVITREQLDDLLDEKSINSLSQPLGVLMVEKGWVRKEELKGYLREHIEECFFFLSSKKKGEFAFLEKMAEENEKLVQVEELVKAVRQMKKTLEEIKKRITSLEVLVKKKADANADDLVDEEEKLFLSFLDGEKKLGDLQRQAGFTEYEAFVLAYNLLEKDLIEIAKD